MRGTGGDAVVAALHRLDVETVFAIASVHNLPILDAMHRDGGFRVIAMRHEQSAVHAADGYARVTGRLGVAITSTGPGAANAMGGLFEASFASSPVLMLTGQVETRFYGQGKGFLHEAEHQVDMLRSLTRTTWSVRRGEDIGETVVAAGRSTLSGRPAPAAVEIPVDLQYAVTEHPDLPASTVFRATPDPDRVFRAAELLGAARRPLIWAGGGVIHADAADLLQRLSERWSIPVVTSTAGRGALPEDHPLCLGPQAAEYPLRQIVEDADVVLAVGTHFQMYPTGFWQVALTDRLIHLDADATVIGRTYPAEIALVADARTGLSALIDAVTTAEAEPGWVELARKAAATTRAAALDRLGPDHRGIMESIRRHLPGTGPVVRDSTVPAYAWGDRLLPILAPRTSLNPVSAAIGPGLPLSIGAAAGTGARTVVIHGDGGIMLTIGELASLAQAGLPVTVCVFNDRGYGILRGIQGATFDGQPHDVDLSTPDFSALAAAFGITATRVRSVDDFDAAFARSVAADGPALIEIDLTSLQPMDYPIGSQELLA